MGKVTHGHCEARDIDHPPVLGGGGRRFQSLSANAAREQMLARFSHARAYGDHSPGAHRESGCGHVATGQNPVPRVNIPIPTKISSKMGGTPTPKWYHWL